MSKKTYSIFGSRMSSTKMVEFIKASLHWIDDFEDAQERFQLCSLLGFQVSCWTNKHGTNMGNNGASDVVAYLCLDRPDERKTWNAAVWKAKLAELCRD